MLKEFDIIYKYFTPLAYAKASLSLKDDAAYYENVQNTVQSVDMLVEGYHFFHHDSPKSIAYKVLGVNLSDIAAMGAVPAYYTMAIALPKRKSMNEQWIKEFCTYLGEIQKEHNLSLIGGDTVFVKGPLSISVNITGFIDKSKSYLSKSNAQEGDILFISNSVGDSYWGLQILKEEKSTFRKFLPSKFKFLNNFDIQNLKDAFFYPKAQVILGQILQKYAKSCTDISDGLWIDVEKLCILSNVRGVINLNEVVFSQAVSKIIKKHGKNIDILTKTITGGDDYQLAFSVQAYKVAELIKQCKELNIFIQQIGYVDKQAKAGLSVMYNDKIVPAPSSKGFEHK